QLLSTSFGPLGNYKLLRDDIGEQIYTNDGATILENLHLQDPICKLLSHVALSQNQLYGDGTTSVILLTCELLRQVQSLKNLSKNVIMDGISKSLEFILKHLHDLSRKFSSNMIKEFFITDEICFTKIHFVPGKTLNDSFIFNGIVLKSIQLVNG